MKKQSVALNLALAISAFALSAALPAMAQTAPALRLTDGVNTVTVDANNVVTVSCPSSPCAVATVTSSGVSGNPGNVSWVGTIGRFNVSEAQGNAQNGNNSNPDIAVVANYTGSSTGTLTVSWTSTGYTGSITAQGIVLTSVAGGTGSVTYSYYIDNSNAVFGEASLVGTLPNEISPVAGPTWPTLATGTYSVTMVQAITLSTGASVNLDNQMDMSAETLTISCALASGTVGTPYSSNIVAAGGTAPYTYSIVSGSLAPGLALNPSTGVVTGTPTSAGTYSYTVEVVDANGIPAISNCGQTIAVGGGGGQGGITLACPSTTGLTQGAFYSSSFVATGGTGKETFSITAGSLPAGLKLNTSTGAVSGTPTGTGSFSFTGKVVDSSSPPQTAKSAACTGTVAPKPPPLSATCATSSGTVGTPYTSAVVASGGTPPYVSYTLISGSLPPGLTLNTSTGAITGTPTTAGTYSYTVQVVDSNGAKASDGSGSGRCSSSGCSITISPLSPDVCGLTPGYWKNHKSWPITSMNLGDHTYNQSQLLWLLSLPKGGDSSLILAFQLIAAKLNVANGTWISTAGNNITLADQLLSGYHESLPYNVSNSQMITVANNLAAFNNDGQLQPGCVLK